MAASKLVELTQSEKEETARKACLDVINHFRRKAKESSDGKEQPEAEKAAGIVAGKGEQIISGIGG